MKMGEVPETGDCSEGCLVLNDCGHAYLQGAG